MSHKNFAGIVALALVTAVIFAVKGVRHLRPGASMLARIGNRIVAENQRRMFDKLLNERLRLLRRPPFVRVHRAAHRRREPREPASLNLLVTAVGRDLLSLIGLVAVMVMQDPVMSLVSLVVVPPAMLRAAQADPPHPRDRA